MNLDTRKIKTVLLCVITVLLFSANPATGWYDETHLSIAKAAGYKKWYHAAGPDIAKIKAGRIESNNHWFNNNKMIEITPEAVLEQVKRYNDPADKEGHLYGAIIASLREYKEAARQGRYGDYHIAYSAHYIGDLSQPLHNIPFDLYNRTHHNANDGIVNMDIFDNINKVKEHVYPIILKDDDFEKSLALEIARIANVSRILGYTLSKESRDMTEKEAYIQLGHSVSLLRAVLKHLRRGTP
jgi:hypothetical protein